MTPIEIQRINGVPGFRQAAAVRRAVFIDEQHVPEDLEEDEHDSYADHYIASSYGRTVAVARMLVSAADRVARIQRVAVLRAYRRRGAATGLMNRMLADAWDAHIHTVTLDAQLQVVAFYRRFGFEDNGADFWEVGIRHVRMTLTTRQFGPDGACVH